MAINSQIDNAIQNRLSQSGVLNLVSSNCEIRNNGSTSQRLANILKNKSNMKDFSYLRKKTNKYFLYQNHISIHKLNLKNKTTLKSHFFNRYPRPMFIRDANFIKEYNQIIYDTQEKTFKLIIQHATSEIDKIQKDLDNYEEEFS